MIILVLLLSWVVLYAARSTVQTMARLRPVVARPSARRSVRA